ncbi:UNVERIFIED_CONTAM: hypothetical protein FKN15_058739 [Acipenser sinensis]
MSLLSASECAVLLFGKVSSVSCAGHNINLCIQKSLEDVQQVHTLVAVASRLVAHFKKSKMVTSALNRKQAEMLNTEKEPLKLIQDVQTRWNMVYYMFECLLELKWPVAVLSNPDLTNKSDAATLDLTTEK